MIVMSDGESDIDGVAGQKWRLLQALGHAPAQGVEDDEVSPRASSQFSVLSSQFFGGHCFFAAAYGGAVGMAAGSGEYRYRGKLLVRGHWFQRLAGCRFVFAGGGQT